MRGDRQAAAGAVVPFSPAPDAASDAPGPDLGPLTAARVEHWCVAYDIPVSTLRALRAQGNGPVTFEVGRLLFCRRADWLAWLEALAATGGSGPISPPASLGRRTDRSSTLSNP
jgi:hypothetical protein